jgi:hypothetical protein
MKSRPKLTSVVIALGLIAAVAIATPVFGLDRGIKKAIKKEVSKQIGKAVGPAGPPGPSGAPGAAGTARGYAQVVSHFGSACATQCLVPVSKGITSVVRASTGTYCVTMPGLTPADTVPVVGVEWSGTSAPQGDGNALYVSGSIGGCSGGTFPVRTYRHPSVTVRDAAGTGTEMVADNAELADNVGFTIVIP